MPRRSRWVRRTRLRVAEAGLQRPDRPPRPDLARLRALAVRMPSADSHLTRQVRQQFEWLAGTGTAVSVEDVVAHLRGSADLQDGAILLTVDVADPLDVPAAAEFVMSCGLPALVFVPGRATDDEVSTQGAVLGRGRRGDLRPEEAQRERGRGVELGIRVADAGRLAQSDSDEALRVIGRGRRAVAEAFGRPPRCFAYPGSGHPSLAERVAVQACGFDLAFSGVHGVVTRFSDPLLLPRIAVEPHDTIADLRAICRGALDGLRPRH